MDFPLYFDSGFKKEKIATQNQKSKKITFLKLPSSLVAMYFASML